MIVKSDNPTQYYDLPVKHAATSVKVGYLLQPGTDAETDDGVLEIAAGAAPDAVGILKKDLLSTTSDTLVNGTVWNLRPVELIDPVKIIQVEYDQSDTMAVASSSGTTLTISSLENNIDTGWIYIVSGTAIGNLVFAATSASGSVVTKTAVSPTADGTETAIKILPLFHQLAKLNSTVDKIGTDAGAGTWTITVLQNWIQKNGAMDILNPTKHEATGLNSIPDLKFFADIVIRNSFAHTTE